MIGKVCPICGAVCGYRRIDDYTRVVRDLVARRVGRVPVARFQCRGTYGGLPTFSMLPVQLVPYYQYTLESIVRALLLWRAFWRQEGKCAGYRTAESVDESLHGESGVTSWRLRCWALLFRAWLRRAQVELVTVYDFAAVRFANAFPPILDELYDYFEVLSRGPPGDDGAGVLDAARAYAAEAGRFLLGVPSQGRGSSRGRRGASSRRFAVEKSHSST